ncbi:TIGR01841 family phasin [Paramagnetospirillum magneticum]|nr:TIGR01841 family phasin [Paramagnetospirillum magneticum]
MLQNFWIGTDFAKLLSSLPVSNDGVKAMLESQARNLAALEEANQHAIDAFHAVFKRQNEILHAAIQESAKLVSAPEEAFSKQAEIARTATEHTLDNLRRMSEMLAAASEKAAAVLNQRVRENMEELKTISRPE